MTAVDTRSAAPAASLQGVSVHRFFFVKLVNAVYLHGNGFWTQPGALAVLGAWGAAGLLFTAFKFRWEPHES